MDKNGVNMIKTAHAVGKKHKLRSMGKYNDPGMGHYAWVVVIGGPIEWGSTQVLVRADLRCMACVVQ